ncbi:MAG: NapC/NirT family cytochrome c [bacterium]|nr:MAG: NapC/NirT family cytochrome c [bacterium]
MKFKLPPSSQNWISLIGATIALISLFMIIFLLAVTVVLEQRAAYLGLVTYILLPAVMVTGLLLIPIGMWLNMRKRVAKKGAKAGWPIINLNDIHHRNAFFVFSIGTTVFLFLSAIGSYEAFHFTESNTFCGTLCHSVMHPEYLAYQNSPHAQVACVACHVGPGANWYVRSKMSGLYQVYATTTNIYPRPIPTPIKNLRPAREVCEQCHWPEKFYAHKIRLETHFLTDEQNTRWDISLVMKIGSPQSALGLVEGIHWHINPHVKVEYIASDAARENLPWVRYTNLETGEVKVYQDQDNLLDQAALDTLEVRTMDCMDCHNRPSHLYRAPTKFINTAMTAGYISPELPEIKALSIELCAQEYPTNDSAMTHIREEITRFYSENYPDIYEQKSDLIENAIVSLQNVFSANIFPEMKVRWDAYPDHIGHLEYNGCFRCHNDLHATDAGEVIDKECNSCHFINAQGVPGNAEVALVGEALEFKHPEDIGESWKESLCVDCHSGLNP